MRKTVQIANDIKKEFPKLEISEEKSQQIAFFLDYLSKWNTKINLTSLKDSEELFKKHVIDSLAFHKCFSKVQIEQCFKRKSILDMGSGAGLPGTIISIFYPESNIVSIDKSNKKIGFQKVIEANLGLLNFKPITKRLNDRIECSEYESCFDTIVSRAFTQIKDLLYMSSFFLKNEGYAVLWKGRKWKEELNLIDKVVMSEFEMISKSSYGILNSEYGGTILLFKKCSLH